MIRALNELNAQLGGLMSLAGFAIGVTSFIAAVYFYFNPKQARFRIRYKVFARDFLSISQIEKWRAASRLAEGAEKFDYFIDLWNSGNETIKDDIIRESVSVSLQKSATDREIRILSAEVDKESHPAISKFTVEMKGGNPVIRWKHFDPGMGLRLRLFVSDRVSADKIVLYAGGLRLNVQRVRQLTERGEAVGYLRTLLVWGLPILALAAAAGKGLEMGRPFIPSGWMAYPTAALVLVAVYAVTIGAILTGIGLNTGFERLINGRSPIEKDTGRPRFTFPDFLLSGPALASLESDDLTLIARAAELGELRAQLESKSSPKPAE